MVYRPAYPRSRARLFILHFQKPWPTILYLYSAPLSNIVCSILRAFIADVSPPSQTRSASSGTRLSRALSVVEAAAGASGPPSFAPSSASSSASATPAIIQQTPSRQTASRESFPLSPPASSSAGGGAGRSASSQHAAQTPSRLAGGEQSIGKCDVLYSPHFLWQVLNARICARGLHRVGLHTVHVCGLREISCNCVWCSDIARARFSTARECVE